MDKYGHTPAIRGTTSVKDPFDKLEIIKTFRLSQALMRQIVTQCQHQNRGFSDFVRNAAIAAMRKPKTANAGIEQ